MEACRRWQAFKGMGHMLRHLATLVQHVEKVHAPTGSIRFRQTNCRMIMSQVYIHKSVTLRSIITINKGNVQTTWGHKHSKTTMTQIFSKAEKKVSYL